MTLKKAKIPAQRSNYVAQKGGCDSAALSRKYAVRITDQIKDTITGDVTNDPVALQYVPQASELKILPQENIDPIGDDAHTPVKGLVHRYPDRVLLKPASVCAVYCRYCFRREKVGPKENKSSDVLSDDEIKAALEYIRSDKNIWEVILTGGDPLVLSPRKLSLILDALEDIDHVSVIRIHTRVPVADPKRITDQMIKALQRTKPVYTVLHINHANEINDAVKNVWQKLHKAGCTLLSQSVLLKGVNNSAAALEDLFRALIKNNVKPYYLHHPDFALGTSHFRLSIKEGQEIVSSLRGRVSGIALPHYMLDIPGGHGKVEINASTLEQLNDGSYMIEDPQGIRHHYVEDSKA